MNRLLMVAVTVTALGCAGIAKANPTFINNFDSSWTNPTLLSEATQAVGAAETILSNLFSNNVTVKIDFDATTATGLADSNFDGANFPSPFGSNNFSYDQIKADMIAHSIAHPENTALASTVAALPGSITCAGCNTSPPHFMLPDAESLALTGAHVPGGASYPYQGYVRLNPTFTYDSNQNDGISAGAFDLTGVMLHEITHVMGRVDFSFCGTCGGAIGSDPWLTVLDLGRFDCGTLNRNSTATNACFSINGGVTDLRKFSDVSDTGDWDSALLSANNAFVSPGTLIGLLPSDILTTNELGWDPIVVASVPEPASLVLFSAGLASLGLIRRRKAG